VAKTLGLNPNSVRARIGELAKEGKIERVSPGFYTITCTHGVHRPRLQNFLAVAHPTPPIRVSETWEYIFTGPPGGSEGVVRLSLRFGKYRNKITWTIKAPLGLDYYGLMFAYGLVKNVVSGKGLFIHEVDSVVNFDRPSCFIIKNVEFLDDKMGLGIEGIKCVTFSDFKGNLEKIYEKPYGIRREIRHTEPRPITELLALYQGGLPSFMIAQSSYDLARAVEKNTEILKYIYRNQSEITLKTNEVLKALFRIIDKFSSNEV
jgi:hypothetical protein